MGKKAKPKRLRPRTRVFVVIDLRGTFYDYEGTVTKVDRFGRGICRGLLRSVTVDCDTLEKPVTVEPVNIRTSKRLARQLAMYKNLNRAEGIINEALNLTQFPAQGTVE